MNETITSSPKFDLPTIIVIFGITGDLVKKKILKALYHLYIKKFLPNKIKIYGFARRDFTDVSIRSYLREIMEEGAYPSPELYDIFLSNFTYIQGNFREVKAYKLLATHLGRVDGEWNMCSNKLFYLAVPPIEYENIIDHIHNSGLTEPCSKDEGWTRVILEKPFGRDLKTAMSLDMRLGELFKEEQIYRVDHYLAKETVKNILTFRFSNAFLAPAWSHEYIEKIEIKLHETQGVEGRGEFYDNVGALRDVGQNHLLQLLTLFIMDPPSINTSVEIKKSRDVALKSLIPSSHEIAKHSVRRQYDGYLDEKGVEKDSTTETYFKIHLHSRLSSFAGVPIFLEAGKYMKEKVTEVIITFKRPLTGLQGGHVPPKNILQYSLHPIEKITMKFVAKKPGYEFEFVEHELGFNYRLAYEEKHFIDDYEALLYDIIKGDQTIFISTEEIISEWNIVEPFINEWKKDSQPLQKYEKNTYDGEKN